MNKIPCIRRLLVDSHAQVLASSDVIGNNAPEIADIVKDLKPGQLVIDYARVKSIEDAHGDTHGIC